MTGRAGTADLLERLPSLVADVRRMRGLSLRDAAEEIGCGFNTLSRVERGQDYTVSVAVKLLRWIGA